MVSRCIRLPRCNIEVVGTACLNNGTDNDIDVSLLVGIHGTFREATPE